MTGSVVPLIGLWVGFMAGVIWVVLLMDSYDMTYKDGQIACINNNIKYELVKQPDGSSRWEEKKK